MLKKISSMSFFALCCFSSKSPPLKDLLFQFIPDHRVDLLSMINNPNFDNFEEGPHCLFESHDFSQGHKDPLIYSQMGKKKIIKEIPYDQNIDSYIAFPTLEKKKIFQNSKKLQKLKLQQESYPIEIDESFFISMYSKGILYRPFVLQQIFFKFLNFLWHCEEEHQYWSEKKLLRYISPKEFNFFIKNLFSISKMLDFDKKETILHMSTESKIISFVLFFHDDWISTLLSKDFFYPQKENQKNRNKYFYNLSLNHQDLFFSIPEIFGCNKYYDIDILNNNIVIFKENKKNLLEIKEKEKYFNIFIEKIKNMKENLSHLPWAMDLKNFNIDIYYENKENNSLFCNFLKNNNEKNRDISDLLMIFLSLYYKLEDPLFAGNIEKPLILPEDMKKKMTSREIKLYTTLTAKLMNYIMKNLKNSPETISDIQKAVTNMKKFLDVKKLFLTPKEKKTLRYPLICHRLEASNVWNYIVPDFDLIYKIIFSYKDSFHQRDKNEMKYEILKILTFSKTIHKTSYESFLLPSFKNNDDVLYEEYFPLLDHLFEAMDIENGYRKDIEKNL